MELRKESLRAALEQVWDSEQCGDFEPPPLYFQSENNPTPLSDISPQTRRHALILFTDSDGNDPRDTSSPGWVFVSRVNKK